MIIEYPACALVVLCGPSGAGKSTFAAKHFAPTQILSSDACRAMVSDSAAAQHVNEDAFSLLYHWLDLRLKNRRFTVVDSTALKPGARAGLTGATQRHHVPCYALLLDVPLDECLRRDLRRPDWTVGEAVIRHHHATFENAKREIAKDPVFAGYHILSPSDMETVTITQGPAASQARTFDIIGDVHGCWTELCQLWEALGYVWGEDGLPRHPDGRIPVFVGDLADRGPNSVAVLQTVTRMVAAGAALFAPGNHDDKLFRLLRGSNVQRTHGLDGTENQLNALPDTERVQLRDDILTYLATAPTHLVLDGGQFIVAHAGIREDLIGHTGGRVREFTLYGDVRGFEPGTNKPIRHDWAADYHGPALIAYGHTPQDELRWVNNTVNLDGGCVFGGFLAALRYPEREFVTVPALARYAERA